MPTLKNIFTLGREVAPHCCVVCGERHRTYEKGGGRWTYIVGAEPLGSMTCSDKCLNVALQRVQETGRADTPEMRIK